MNIYMKEALNQAKKAYKINECPIGAVIVKDGKIIARGYNKREKTNLATSHAEIEAINKACKKMNSWRLDGCEMYITLEPCLMCLGAITQARISKIYIGTIEPKNGAIFSALKYENVNTTHKIKYELLNELECSEILIEFFKKIRKNNK